MAQATPVLPFIAANEVPLYLISMAAGETHIREEDARDLRESPTTLCGVSDLAGKTKINIAILRELVECNADIGFLIVAGRMLNSSTMKDILQSLQVQFNVSRELPVIRYDSPKVSLTDPNSSKIIASGAVENELLVVNVEISGVINFGDTNLILTPDKFPNEV